MSVRTRPGVGRLAVTLAFAPVLLLAGPASGASDNPFACPTRQVPTDLPAALLAIELGETTDTAIRDDLYRRVLSLALDCAKEDGISEAEFQDYNGDIFEYMFYLASREGLRQSKFPVDEIAEKILAPGDDWNYDVAEVLIKNGVQWESLSERTRSLFGVYTATLQSLEPKLLALR